MAGCPAAADDDLFGQAIVVASAYWAIGFLSWLSFAEVMQADRSWGMTTIRQRYLYGLDVATQTCEDYNYLEALGETFRTILSQLRLLWPATVALPYYPVFQRP